MRLALGLRAINSARASPSAYLELAQVAERCGYEEIWAPEIRATDPFALLGWIGSGTTRIGLGCGVAQIFARTAVATAASAVTLDSLSGGRFRLGLGVADPQIVEGWHDRSYNNPLSYMRDYLAVVRMALKGEPIQYAGQEITLPLPTARDDVVPLRLPTPPRRIPVYLAGIGRNAVALAGELADGWMAAHSPPAHIRLARSWIEEGAARSGRSLDGFRISATVICAVDDDEDLARDLVRPALVACFAGVGSGRPNFYVRHAARLGFGHAAQAAHQAHLAGDIARAVAAVDDGLIDAMSLCGSEDRVRETLAAYREAGVDTLAIVPASPSHIASLAQIELISTMSDE